MTDDPVDENGHVILTNPEWWCRDLSKGRMYVKIVGAFGRASGAVDLEYHAGTPDDEAVMTTKYKSLDIARRVLVARAYRRVDRL